MHSSLLCLSVMAVISLCTVKVHCRLHPSVEEVASNYIVSRLFPSHSMLASKLFNVLLNSAEDNYQQQQQQQYDDEDVDESRVSNDSSDETLEDEDEVSESRPHVSRDSSSSSLGGVRGSSSLDGVVSRQVEKSKNDFGRRLRRLQKKRGLGYCIHNCINGRGNMNFIQCKSMCH